MDEIARMEERLCLYAEREAETNSDFLRYLEMKKQLGLRFGAESAEVIRYANVFSNDSEICALMHPFKRQKNGASPLHRHTYFEMGYVFRGTAISISDGVETRLSEGDLFIVNTQALHQMKTCSELDYVFNIMIQHTLFDDHFLCLIAEYDRFSRFFLDSILNNPSASCLIFHSGAEGGFTFYVDKILCEILFSEQYDQNYLRLLLACLFRELSRQYQRTMEERSRQENAGLSITTVLQYLTEHYRDATLQSTAQFFHYSSRFLSSFVARCTGSSFAHILREIKLQNADRLVRQTDLSFEEIAHAVGYNGRDYLDRLFKNRFGRTMSEQRKA